MAVPCLLRYKRKLSLPCIGRRYLHNDSKANLLNGWQIADIVIGTRSSGVRVNRNGELQVTSEENSRRGHKTALVLSRASPSLTGYDIRRIFESQNDTPNDLTDRGLEEAFPFRQYQTLQRRDSWVLIFASPADAKRYQQIMLRPQHLYSKVPPIPDPTAINTVAPSLSLQRRPHRAKMYSYALTRPFQRLSLTAKIFPFEPTLQRAIGVHKGLIPPRAIEEQIFPVRLSVACLGYLSVEYIKKLLQLDGIARGRPWAVSGDDNAVVQVGPGDSSKLLQMPLRDLRIRSPAALADNWRINFLLSSDAAHFARVWHRRPFPRLDDSWDGRSLILKAECLF